MVPVETLFWAAVIVLGLSLATAAGLALIYRTWRMLLLTPLLAVIWYGVLQVANQLLLWLK